MAQSGVHAYSPNVGNTVGLCFLSIILPPIPVFLVRGVHADLLINFLLFIFGYLPGVIHAIYIVCKYAGPKPKSPKEKYDISASRHAPSPGPITEIRPSAEQPVAAVHPFLAGGGSQIHAEAEVVPASQRGGQGGDGQERDLPVYEEVAGGSQVGRSATRSDTKGA